MGIDETWRWRFREDEFLFNRFWVQTIRYLSRTRITKTDMRLDRQTPYRLGEPIKVLVRPEKMEIMSDGSPDKEKVNRLDGVVRAVSFIGGMTRLELETKHGTPFLVKTISQRAALRTRPGEALQVRWLASDTVVLAS